MRDPEMIFEIHTYASPDIAEPLSSNSIWAVIAGDLEMQLAPMPTVINRIVNIPSIAPFNLSLLERFPRGAISRQARHSPRSRRAGSASP